MNEVVAINKYENIFFRLNIDHYLLGILFIASILIFGLDLNSGGFWWTDESRHAMDGVFILDLLKDRPFSRLYDYAVEYFVHYPALGFTWYLPFFALVESFFFSIFGISAAIARFTELFFILLTILAWYAWAKPIWGRIPVFFSICLFLVSPQVILWSRAIMLEVPALAMMMLSLYAFSCYLKKPSHWLSIVTGLIIGSMLLTKQLSVLLFPILLAEIWASGAWKKAMQLKSLAGSLIIAVALAIVAMHAMKFGSTAMGNLETNAGNIISIERFGLNFKAAWEAYPPPFWLLIGAGVATMLKVKRQRSDFILMTWIISWFILFAIFSNYYANTLRYTIYMTPAIALISTRWLSEITNSSIKKYAIGLLTIFYSGYGLARINEQALFVNGYEKAAAYVLASPSKAPILFCCKHDGNFIFDTRIGDPKRNKIILRADKILVSIATMKVFGVKSYVTSDKDIFELLDRYGIELIVAENKDIVGTPELTRLIELLKTDAFEKLKSIDISTNVPQFKDLSVNIYRYKSSKPIANGEIEIPMPHIGRTLHLKLEN